MSARTKLVVLNEHTLGYITPGLPDVVHHLHASVLRGATNTGIGASTTIVLGDSVRLAGPKDFDEYRVVFEGYGNPDEYEYDESGTAHAGKGISRIKGFDRFKLDGEQFEWSDQDGQYLSATGRRLVDSDISVFLLNGEPIMVADPKTARTIYKNLAAGNDSPEDRAELLGSAGALLGVDCWEGELTLAHAGGSETAMLAAPGEEPSPGNG